MLHQRAKAAISTLNLQEIILPNIHNFVWPGGPMLAYLMLHLQVGIRTQTRTQIAILSL